MNNWATIQATGGSLRAMKGQASVGRASVFAMAAITLCAMGCEDPIRMSPATSSNSSSIELSASGRGGYDWKVTDDEFETHKPSMFTFFSKVSQAVAQWDPEKDRKLITEPVVRPEGISDNAFRTFSLAANPVQQPVQQCEIPRNAISTHHNAVVNVAGDRVLTCDGSKLQWWDVSTGKSLSDIQLQIKDVQLICLTPDQDHALLTNGKLIQCVSLESGVVLAQSSPLEEPILQWQIARDVPVVIAKTESGKVFVFDEKLADISTLSTETAQGNVAINADATRVAFWSNNAPIEIQLKNLRAVSKDFPSNFSGTQTQLTCMGAGQTRWMHTDSLLEWDQQDFGKSMNDRYWNRDRIFWTPVAMWSESRGGNDDSLLIQAIRYTSEGKAQHVLLDVAMEAGYTSIPYLLEGDVSKVIPSLDGETLLVLTNNSAKVYERIRWQYLTMFTFQDGVAATFRSGDFHSLDIIGEMILAEERWWRYNMSSQEMYSEFVLALGREWHRETRRTDLEEQLAAAEAWLQEGGIVARLAKASYHHQKSAEHRGSGTINTVTSDALQKFREEIEKEITILVTILEEESPPPLATYVMMMSSYRASELGLEGRQEVLSRCVQDYPGAWSPHKRLMLWLLPRWGGAAGEADAYVNSLANLHQREYGDFLYAKILVPFYHDAKRMRAPDKEVGMQMNRVQRGMEASLKLPGVDFDFMALSIEYASEDMPREAKTAFLQKYYEHFPLLDSTVQFNQVINGLSSVHAEFESRGRSHN